MDTALLLIMWMFCTLLPCAVAFFVEAFEPYRVAKHAKKGFWRHAIWKYLVGVKATIGLICVSLAGGVALVWTDFLRQEVGEALANVFVTAAFAAAMLAPAFAYGRLLRRYEGLVNKRINNLDVLTSIKDDLKQLKERVYEHVAGVRNRAGQQLLSAMNDHGLFPKDEYSGLWSSIRIGEVSPTTGKATPLGEAVFFMAISWWLQEVASNGKSREEYVTAWDDEQKCRFGLARFIREINRLIRRERSRLGQ